MKEPSWSLQVKMRDNYLCKFCGEGAFDHKIIEAHHIKRKADRPDLADNIDNGETLCMFDHAKEHYKMGDFWGCVLILLRLLWLMRRRAHWPTIKFQDYQTVRTLYHEGYNYTEAAKILGCSPSTVRRRIQKLKTYYPDLITEKGELYYIPLPENVENLLKQVF